MIVKTISYKRIKNLGNYETETLEITAEIDENESPSEAINQIRKLVLDGLKISESEERGIAF